MVSKYLQTQNLSWSLAQRIIFPEYSSWINIPNLATFPRAITVIKLALLIGGGVVLDSMSNSQILALLSRIGERPTDSKMNNSRILIVRMESFDINNNNYFKVMDIPLQLRMKKIWFSKPLVFTY